MNLTPKLGRPIKITAEQKADIRQRWFNRPTYKSLCAEFGICPATLKIVLKTNPPKKTQRPC